MMTELGKKDNMKLEKTTATATTRKIMMMRNGRGIDGDGNENNEA